MLRSVPFTATVVPCLLLGLSSVGAESRLAVPTEGEPFPAEIMAIDRSWQIAFKTAAGLRCEDANALVKWGECVEPGRGPYLVLVDGGLVVADILSADKQSLVADSVSFGEMKVPLELAAGVVFQPLADRGRRERLIDRLVAFKGDSDRVLLTNDDEITGTIRSIHAGKIRVETGVGPVDVDVHRTRAVIYNSALRRTASKSGVRMLAGFVDGSLLSAAELTLDQKSLRLAVPGGPAWTATPTSLVSLQPLGSRNVYLSDLIPTEYRFVPYLDLKWPYRVDRSVLGARLHNSGVIYPKGLGLHSTSRLTYLLAEPYRRFRAQLAVDDETDGRGSVGFRVFADGRQVYSSPVVRGGRAPIAISIDVTGVKRLDLVVDFADRGDELDHADWLDARLVR